MTTPTRPRRKTPRAERREQRAARSRAARQQHVQAKAAAAGTPLDLFEVAYSTLRGRWVQSLRKAEASVDRANRAGDARRLAAAERRLAGVRALVERESSEVVAFLEARANRIDTARR
jgi:hypothetical protein